MTLWTSLKDFWRVRVLPCPRYSIWAEGYIRFSFATDVDTIEEGIRKELKEGLGEG